MKITIHRLVVAASLVLGGVAVVAPAAQGAVGPARDAHDRSGAVAHARRSRLRTPRSTPTLDPESPHSRCSGRSTPTTGSVSAHQRAPSDRSR